MNYSSCDVDLWYSTVIIIDYVLSLLKTNSVISIGVKNWNYTGQFYESTCHYFMAESLLTTKRELSIVLTLLFEGIWMTCHWYAVHYLKKGSVSVKILKDIISVLPFVYQLWSPPKSTACSRNLFHWMYILYYSTSMFHTSLKSWAMTVHKLAVIIVKPETDLYQSFKPP